MGPKISVLMPIYNVEKYLDEAIESILNQTYTDFELLLLDDCSTDGTAAIAQKYTDSRIRYHRNERNLGLSENLNEGIRLSKGEFIARMDGDDICLPHRLEKQMAILDANPEIDICGASYRFFGTKNETQIYPKTHEEIKVNMLFGCFVILPLLRKRVWTKNNLWYKTEAFPAEDYKMWVDCLHVAKIENIQEVLFLYRMHAEQVSTARKIKQKEKADLVRLEMLNWLSPDFTDEEKTFYCDVFVSGNEFTEEEFMQCWAFKQKMLDYNIRYGNFNPEILHIRLEQQLTYLAYKTAINMFHPHYSLPIFFRCLRSPMSKYIPSKNKVKLFIKSLFCYST